MSARKTAPTALAPDSALFVLLVAGMMTVSAMSTDINLPAIPVMAVGFGAGLGTAQLTVTLFFVGFGVGQLIVGPLSDRVGRRPVLLGGLGLYVLATLACALATTLDGLLVWRTLQGLFAAAGPVLGRAIVRDLFEGARMARVMSFATAAFIVAPIVAPSIGALLLELGSWRAIFGFLALYGLALVLLCWRWLGETLAVADPMALAPRRFVAAWAAVARHPRSRIFGAVSLANFVALLVYLTNSPAVFMSAYGLAPRQFGVVFAAVALCSAVGSLINARLVGLLPLEHLIAIALAGATLASAAGALALHWGFAPLWLLVVLFAAIFFCFSSVMSNATALAMQPHGSIVGAASSVLGVIQTVVPALVASAVAGLWGGGPMPTMLTMGSAFAVALLLALRGIARREASRREVSDKWDHVRGGPS